MSKMFDKIKSWYETGYWTEEMVRAAEGRWLTTEEVEQILGGEELND